ncbi:MAG: alpha/beta hydrolase domain-containing protein [Solirubrobacterales bacterium]
MRTRFVALLVGAIALLTVGAAPALGAMSDIETPTVTGPIAVTADSTPWAATDKPLGDYGYVEEEFKYSGDAFAYDTSGPADQTGTKIPTGGPADDGKYPYKTRMIVRRPTNPADFNGTVIVEWLNVTAQFDLEANWYGDPDYLLKNGYAYVGVSAQRVGVNWLRNWDASRYGDLDVSARDGSTETITNDALSYDIYSAAIKALLDGGNGPDPLGSLPKPDTVVASGESQSGSRLSTYYNKVQPIHDVVDAFLLTVSTSALRHDTATPAIRILSETENRVPRTEPDADNYRQWEVAGGSHLPRMAFENFQKPIERDTGLTLSASCVKYPLSRVQWPYVVNSAYEHLVDWANGGPAPPIAPRGSYQDMPADPNNQLERDDLGIAQGAIRLPEMTDPVRLNSGINSADPGGGGIFSAFCGLLGSSEDLTNAVLKQRYEDWGDYIDRVKAQAEDVAGQGFILDQDVPRLIAQHKQVYTLRPTKPKRSGKKKPSDSKFKLSWKGSTAPDTTFELQHSADGGDTWTTVKGAKEVAGTSFKIDEKRGTWIYKVRSTTIVPADAARPSFTVTTPFSKRSTKAKVNG